MSHSHSHDHHHGHHHDHADHSHGHDHAHDGHAHHGHHHAPVDFGRAFLIGITLNTVFVGVEALYGYLANSTALLADAGHNLSDVLGLATAWIAAVLSKRAPTARYTYGLRNTSILAALANAMLLLIASGAILLEAVQRLLEPEPVKSVTVMVVAAIGILVNGATAWLFASGQKGDINIRGAYLHMIADAAISAGVVVAGLLILLTGWLWVDPFTSLIVVGVIVWGTWGLLRESTAMSLAAVPTSIDPVAVRALLASRPGVSSIHDLHIWPMSTTETALTAHLVTPAGHPGDDFLIETCRLLHERFQIGHSTIQIEISEQSNCTLAPEHVI
ncbi:cation diffusion facilitator family transporter [Afipia felis]|uniref:Cadmium, cobalt and zinc/H(+)-K(+) antiporter n=2 Tax=Afipia felis TaxID=1035 RepID=A0A380W519_AFIFE|nr:cation diffusion facilitator family transporter [Afipia felis]EKS30887.1 cation diffusion facilitator family transporter [Afipia felis ATCC 53690]SUU75632.1 Cadmium, cobalt and zinc/H(+)-K(+) antiporter [Afipia felis]SUU83699.1 Cadmium, cobalt and zinc/H(+)-K(+) antiporter [Afipia felis]